MVLPIVKSLKYISEVKLMIMKSKVYKSNFGNQIALLQLSKKRPTSHECPRNFNFITITIRSN